jgi:hypothetical protein
LSVDFLAAGLLEGLAEESLMLPEDLGVRLTKLLHQPRRPLDVREEEGDGSARQVGHCRTSSATGKVLRFLVRR